MKTKIKNIPNMVEARKRNSTPTFFMNGSTQHTKEALQYLKDKKYYIHTYGCQANIRDEETMKGLLGVVSMKETSEPKEADVIIINTCAVRENAEDKVYGEIGNLKYLRNDNWRDYSLNLNI